MSEKTQENLNKTLSQDEKVELLKATFSTLEIDQKAIFTQWCHEEVEKGAPALLGQKLQEASDKMSSFIAKAYDQVTKGAELVYEKTNEAFEPREEEARKDTNKDDGPSFFK